MTCLRDDVLRSLLQEDHSGGQSRGRFLFPPDLPVFVGHFPDFPVVPGVYLVEAARALSERALGRPLRIAAIEDAKFTSEVFPGDPVDVESILREVGACWTCQATLTARDRRAAKICLRLVKDNS